MAETVKKVAADNKPTDQIEEAPRESPSASLKVCTVFPHSSFAIEGLPVITAEGTMLTKTQLSEVEKKAAEYGVTLESEEVK